VCMPETGTLAIKPANMSYEEAAAVPYGALTAVSLLKKVNIQRGQKVLINGASGAIGSAAVQLAKYFGAEVTGVCSTPRLEFVKSLGADHVIDYANEDFTKNEEKYDLILEMIAHRSAKAYARALKPGGTAYFVGGSVATIFQILILGPRIKRKTGKNVHMLMVPQNRTDLIAITELVQAGKIRPVIDRTWPLSETAEAMRYVAEGRALGKVVIQVA